MIRSTRRMLLLIGSLALAGFSGSGLGLQSITSAAGPAGTVPTGLPSHVMLGLANAPGDTGWMTSSGAKWDARYQYLSGGVTGSGWSTWNSPAGAFALYYMQDSGNNGILPVFSYYQLLQSLPNSSSTTESEADKDYNNLNDTTTMDAYYADFKLLMDQAHTYGKPVIVQVEPDLWGYMEQRAGSCGLASCVSASVASSGYADVSGYPNTVQGFAEALLHLRDTYAPNVIMAIHASCWGSGADVCTYPTSTSDTASHAQQDATFLSSTGISGNQAGTSSWDLVFTDTSDRDAGYYQYYGNSHMWWDPTNSSLPDFANFGTWLAGINAGTNRRIVLWQTPIGNQYFETDNNTTNHYQDNRAQYFLGDGPSYSHLTDFANDGVIGVLFGGGAGGTTSYEDSPKDGITNPAPVSSFQCNLCNTHVSQYSDNDGGYLRIFGGDYLNAGGIPIPGSAAPTMAMAVKIAGTSVSPNSVYPRKTETLAATVTANEVLSGAIVDFEVYNAAGTRVYQTYQSAQSFAAGIPRTFKATWTVPNKQAAGTYTYKLGVFGPNWSPLYAWDGSAGTFSIA